MSSHFDENGDDVQEDSSLQSVEPEKLYGDSAFDDSFHDQYWSSQSTIAIPMLDETEGADRFSCLKCPEEYFNGLFTRF